MTGREKRRQRAVRLLWLNLVVIAVMLALAVPSLTIWAHSVRWVIILSVWALVQGGIDGALVCLSELEMLRDADG